MITSLVLAAFACPAEPPEPIAAIPRMTSSRGLATAVVVGRQENKLYLLTADHAIGPDTTELKFDFFRKPSSLLPEFTLKGAKIAVHRPIADFALLEVTVPKDHNVPKLDLAPPGLRRKTFPFQGVTWGSSRGGVPTGEIVSVIAKRIATRKLDELAFFWETDLAQVSGRSGGPLLDGDGRILGIGVATDFGKGYFTHSSEIQAVLKQAGYSWLWDPKILGK